MATTLAKKRVSQFVLQAATAADLMTLNPVTIDADATVREAIGLLVDKGFSAAPVVDEDERLVGVISQSDVVSYDRGKFSFVVEGSEDYDRGGESFQQADFNAAGFQIVDTDRTRVRDIMTPVVFSVSAKTPADQVVKEMLERKIHRVFVVVHGILLGVISAMDVLRHLRRVRAAT